MDAESDRVNAASVACIARVLATTEQILALLLRRKKEEAPDAAGDGGAAGQPVRKRARGADASRAAGTAPVIAPRAPPAGRDASEDAAYPRGRPKLSLGVGLLVFPGPAGRIHVTAPSAAVVVSELREHASRIGVPVPADGGPAPAASGLLGDNAAARSMLTTYVETLEAAFGSDIFSAPRYGRRRTVGDSRGLLNWLWTVPAASASVTAAAAAAVTRREAAARAARDADADTLPGRLRRCVPVGRGFYKSPSAACISSELREHASRIGVPLPVVGITASSLGPLTGDDAAARSMLTTYAGALEAAFGSDVCTAPRDGRYYDNSATLLNWLWTVPAASDSAAAAGPSSARAAAAGR